MATTNATTLASGEILTSTIVRSRMRSSIVTVTPRAVAAIDTSAAAAIAMTFAI